MDPRIKLELQISQKLFNMQKNNKKAHLISQKFKEVSWIILNSSIFHIIFPLIWYLVQNTKDDEIEMKFILI